jgi:molybdopterin-guanine dinucleotide biosynthesis protein A
MSLQSITGIVLAGGKSARMGTDKALLIYNGFSLLQNAIKILEQVCDKVVISAPEGRYNLHGYECWPDELPVNSAMTGVYSCLKRSETRINVILTCDMPLMDSKFLGDLLSCVPGKDAVVPVHDRDFIEPLCAVYTKNAVPSIEESMQLEKYSMHEWVCNSRHFLYPAEQSSNYRRQIFTNINRVEDFDLLVNS